MCCYFKTALTEFAPHHTESKSGRWCSSKRHCYRCGQGRIQGGMWGCIPPPAIFKHVFDEYNFSMISNLFHYNKPYALSTHNRKCTNKKHYLVKHSDLGAKNLKQNLPKSCSKSTKIATPHYLIQNFIPLTKIFWIRS